MMELREGMDVANRVRFYLRRVTDYAMHDLEPVRYMHVEVEVPALAEILRREQEYPWHVVGVELVEDIGGGAKVEGAGLIPRGGDRGWPTRESERARLVAEVGECCRGADPLCAAGCLVAAALRQRLANKVRGEA